MDTVDRKQIDLNNELYLACTTLPVDYSRIEALLQQGAQPLGEEIPPNMDYANGCFDGCLYTNVISHYLDHDQTSDTLYRITELFLKYGMDIDHPVIPYDEDWFIHPMWMLGFPSDINFMHVLELLMDAGMTTDSASECWYHQFFHFNLFYKPEEELYESVCEDTFRKIFFFASYPQIWTEDEYLQSMFLCEDKESDPMQFYHFRRWEQFTYEIQCGVFEHNGKPYNTRIVIFDKDSGDLLYQFQFGNWRD